MTSAALHTQKGLSLLGLLFWMALLGSIFLVGMKTVPIVSEYLAIRSAVNQAKTAGDEKAIRSSFDQQVIAGYHNQFTGRDLVIENTDGLVSVSFAYQRVVPLAGPVSFLFDFTGKALVR